MTAWIVMLSFLSLLTAAFGFGEFAPQHNDAVIALFMIFTVALVASLASLGIKKDAVIGQVLHRH